MKTTDSLVAVTGASGHVGCNLVRELVRRGVRVRAVVPATSRSIDGLPIEIAIADVRHPETLRAAFRGVDTVFHLAARISIDADRDGQVHAVNVHGARNAAAAALAAGVRRFVHMSSVHAFDLSLTEGELDETSRRAREGRPAYDRSKAAGEDAIRAAIARGLDAVIVNPVAVIGPHDYGPSHMGRAIIDFARGRVPVVPDGGFSFVDVRDVVAGTLAAAERGRQGESYLLPGHWLSSVDVARVGSRFADVRIPRTLPAEPFRVAARVLAFGAHVLRRDPLLTPEMVETLQGNRRISGAKAARELGHAPRPIDETIRDTYAWFRERGLLPTARRLDGASA